MEASGVIGTGRSFRAVGGAMGAVVLLAASANAGLFQTNGDIIAYNGMDVPGMPGVTFGGSGTFDSPVIDETGAVLFRGRMTGTGVVATNERALFRGPSAAGLSMVIRSADPAPGLPGLTLNTATASGIGNTYRLSPDGRTLWGSSLSGPGVVAANDTAMFGGYAGSLGLIAREGDPAPGTVGATYSSAFNSPSATSNIINRNGRVLFKSSLLGGDVVGSTNNDAYFTGTMGSVSMMLRKGDVVTGGGATAATLGSLSQMNNSGQVYYDLTLGGTATTANNASLWAHTPGSGNTLLVREGDSAPGTAGATIGNAANSLFFNVGNNNFTRSGSYAFYTELVNGDVVAGVNDRALYTGVVGGGLTVATRRGDAAPGTDALFGIINGANSIVNDSGQIVFPGNLTGGTVTTANDTGLWTGMPGSLSLVAREGSPAPGTVGAMFDAFLGPSSSLNDLGTVLFNGSLIGGDVVPGVNTLALFAWDSLGGLTQVLRTGDSVEIAPGIFRTIAGWTRNTFNNADGAASGFSHENMVALRLDFTDGSTAIASVYVPEPATLGFILSALAMVARRRRTR